MKSSLSSLHDFFIRSAVLGILASSFMASEGYQSFSSSEEFYRLVLFVNKFWWIWVFFLQCCDLFTFSKIDRFVEICGELQCFFRIYKINSIFVRLLTLSDDLQNQQPLLVSLY